MLLLYPTPDYVSTNVMQTFGWPCWSPVSKFLICCAASSGSCKLASSMNSHVLPFESMKKRYLEEEDRMHLNGLSVVTCVDERHTDVSVAVAPDRCALINFVIAL